MASPPLAPHQERLAARLRAYSTAEPAEEAHRARILRQVTGEPRWWHRATLPGHVTGSAFVADPAVEVLLLTHHRELDRWLQLGGHDEGERDPAATALREAREESGLEDLDFLGGRPSIFDLDVHAIPARGAMPEHDHLDVRYLLVARPGQPLRRREAESRALAWVPIGEMLERMAEAGAARVQRKLLLLREELAQLRGGASSK